MNEKDYIFNEYYICLGMDNIETLTTWYNWKPFVEEYNFVACVREGQNLDTALKEANLMEYKDHFTEIQIPENHTSSSLVRDLCEKGEFEKVKELAYENLDEALIFFIDSEKIYLKNQGQEINPITLKLLENLKKEI